jgi:hypothetical protein
MPSRRAVRSLFFKGFLTCLAIAVLAFTWICLERVRFSNEEQAVYSAYLSRKTLNEDQHRTSNGPVTVLIENRTVP